MLITGDLNDQLMCMSAFRYALGRKSYIVGATIDWITDHWGQFNDNTKFVIVRDTIKALADGYAGATMDSDNWKNLVIKLLRTDGADSTLVHWLQTHFERDVSQRKDLFVRLREAAIWADREAAKDSQK